MTETGLIEMYAQHLERKASGLVLRFMMLGGLVGAGLGGFPLFQSASNALVPHTLGYGTLLLGALAGGYLGWSVGERRAVEPRFQAQIALHQLQVEQALMRQVAARPAPAPRPAAPAAPAPVAAPVSVPVPVAAPTAPAPAPVAVRPSVPAPVAPAPAPVSPPPAPPVVQVAPAPAPAPTPAPVPEPAPAPAEEPEALPPAALAPPPRLVQPPLSSTGA